MFDAIGVSERTRKPWTVAVSFTGQAVLIGMAVLVPLMSTEGLTHPLGWVTVPEPPRALPRRAAQAPVKPASAVPFQMNRRALQLPTAIPAKVAMIQDRDLPPEMGDAAVGVPGGFGDATGAANGVIDGLVRVMPAPPPVFRVKLAAESAPVQRIRVGGKVQEGKLISGPRPVYPALARAARVEGTVRLAAVISRDGTILDLRAVSGHPLLIPAALAAVQHWVFRPTTLNGDPVEVATDIEVNFMLQK